MEHPIVEKILKEGVGSVNLEMLDEAAKKRILTECSERLFKQGRFKETIEILSKNNDVQKLYDIGDSFISQGKTELATMFLIPTKDKKKLNSAAMLCIQSQNYALAAMAYDAADNKQMASFIKENFCKLNKLPECGKSLSKSLV